MAKNIYYDYILGGLQTVLSTGLNMPVYLDGDVSGGSDFIELIPAGMSLVSYETKGSTFRYPVDICYHSATKLDYKTLTQRAHNILETLNNEVNYVTGGVYYWHDGQVETVSFPEIIDENGPCTIVLSWFGTHNEVTG